METQTRLMKMLVECQWHDCQVADRYSGWAINAVDFRKAFMYCINDETKTYNQLQPGDEVVVTLRISKEGDNTFLYLPFTNEKLPLRHSAMSEMTNLPSDIETQIIP